MNWSNLEIISWILERSLFVAITPTYLHTYTYIVYVIAHLGNKEISITCSWTIVTSRYPISSRKHRRSWHGLTTPPFFLYNFLFASLFSIKFLYFFIISSLFPYFNLFVSIFIQSYVASNCMWIISICNLMLT